MAMFNPCHPGDVLKETLGPDGLNVSVTEAARRLGVSRVSLSRVINGRAAMSPELAVRLEKAKLSTARLWLDMQSAYDLDRALKRKHPKIVPFKWEQTEAA
jgi:addiction module HigA family antidote